MRDGIGIKRRKRETYSGPIFSDQTLQGMWSKDLLLNREMIEATCSVGAPKETLPELLKTFTRDYLKELADDYTLQFKSSASKSHMVEELGERIIQRFPHSLPYMPVANIEYLWNFHEGPLVEIPKEELFYKDISHVQNFGFLFIFNTGSTYTTVFPRELLPLLGSMDKEALLSAAELHQRLNAYAVSLSNLYGVLDIDQFATIWNKYEAEIFTPAEAGDELAILSSVQYYYWYVNEMIVCSYFLDLAEVEEFLPNVKDVPYYSPTRDELVDHFQNSYDDRSPAAHAMMEFLSGYEIKNTENLDSLMADIYDVCVADDGIQEVFDVLDEYGLLLKGMDEVARFTQLYTELSNHAHKWVLRGHTPLALNRKVSVVMKTSPSN
jgi:hypothetical protein